MEGPNTAGVNSPTCPLGSDSVDIGGLVEFRRGDRRTVVLTSAAALLRTRRTTQAAGVLVSLAAIVGGWWHPAVWLAAPIGFLVAAYLPGRLRQEMLLLLDSTQGIMRSSQHGTDGQAIPLSEVTCLRGAYETQGWDGRSVVFAVDAEGGQHPILALPGTDEAAAARICALLGALTQKPASYTGPFGKPLHFPR